MASAQRAIHWWNYILTDYGRKQFPQPQSNHDIISYYLNPKQYIPLR